MDKKPEAKLEKDYIISIDMGGTKIQSAVLNSKEGIISKLKVATGHGTSNYYVEKIASVINETIENSGVKPEEIKAVAIGVPGTVNSHTGTIHIAPNLGIKNYDFTDNLKKYIPYQVILENDVNLGALGVKYYGIGKDAANMLVVFVGTGIGGGIILDNKLYRGSSFAAGEIGHIHATDRKVKCGCGKIGCFEAIASRTAIVRGIIHDYRLGEKTVLADTIDEKKPIKSKALKNAVDKDDKLVIKHIEESCMYIGTVLSNINNLMNFDMIVLGGGVIEALDKYMIPLIKEYFKKNSLEVAGKHVKIKSSKLKDEAPLYGGLALADEFLGIKY